MSRLSKIVVVLGPTASGKSDLAVALAKKISARGGSAFGGNGAEIISADSRQVYRGLNIGTGKITKREMRGVPHYLLDVASPKNVFTASMYERLAKQAINRILRKGKLPIICGGTGFYIAAALEEKTFAEVPPNLKLRKKLERKSTEVLFTQLQKLDPERAASIDLQNPRRLVRALEIVLTTGKPVGPRNRKEMYDALKLGVTWPKNILQKRIHARLLKRLRGGMINEVKKLGKDGVSSARLESLGLEYRYVGRFLEGLLDKKEMAPQLEREIVAYSKRQLTWFKKDKNIHWITGVRGAEFLIRRFLSD